MHFCTSVLNSNLCKCTYDNENEQKCCRKNLISFIILKIIEGRGGSGRIQIRTNNGICVREWIRNIRCEVLSQWKRVLQIPGAGLLSPLCEHGGPDPRRHSQVHQQIRLRPPGSRYTPNTVTNTSTSTAALKSGVALNVR
jgi:hypothetical protein